MVTYTFRQENYLERDKERKREWEKEREKNTYNKKKEDRKVKKWENALIERKGKDKTEWWKSSDSKRW